MDENVTYLLDNGNDSHNMTNTAILDPDSSKDDSVTFNAIKIIILVIACTGVVTNITVVFVFLNDIKMRRKIPNICIINQVCTFLIFFFKINKYQGVKNFTLVARMHIIEARSYTKLRVTNDESSMF